MSDREGRTGGDELDSPARRATDGLSWQRRDEPPDLLRADIPPPIDRPRRRFPWPVAALAGASAICGGLVAGLVVAWTAGGRADREAAPPVVSRPGTTLTVQQTSAVAEAAARGRASVVKIVSTRHTPGGAAEQDVGSGVVIDAQGHIITNAHVVLGTETLKIFLADGTEQAAILIGHDSPFTDLAVLQVGPGKAQPIEAGDSSLLSLGEAVVAIGNPLAEFDGSVSVGVVSGLNRRQVLDAVRQDDLIQTDAALNTGNSGGALLDLKGQLVGMPSLVLRESRSRVAVEGVGFALPSNRVLQVARRIIETGGAYPRPTLGLDHIDISSELLDRNTRLPVEAGALVRAVVPLGPAAAAGIVAGDVITRLGNDDVNRDRPLLNALESFEPGEAVRVVLNRGGRIIEVEVRLGKRA